jgi:catechol 2,3-dioxygenase-like lactoylglutathione lyase family enzyme
MTNLPLPTLDHVVINVRDQLDAAAPLYERLGFNLTPRGHHTLGSMNNLAIFGTDYLELIAVPPNSTKRSSILAYPCGVNAVVFGAEDADRIHARLIEAGAPVLAPNDFSRPVEFAGGSGDAAFRTLHVSPEAFPAGRLYFCQHRTRGLVWRDEWRRHANGAVGVAGITSVSAEPKAMGALLGQMFGTDLVQTIDGGIRMLVGLSSFDILTQEAATERFGGALPDAEGRTDYMAALSFRTSSLDAAARHFADNDIKAEQSASGVLVAARDTMGATLEFVD